MVPQEQHGSRGLKKKNVWFGADPLVASILVTKQQPRHHTRGLAASPALHRGPCTSILSDWLKNRVRQGRNSLPGLKGAGGSISGGGVHCQQQELLVFRGPWRDSDSQKPQTKYLNRNLRSKQYLRHRSSLRGWDKLSYK